MLVSCKCCEREGYLHISRKSNVNDSSILAESLTNSILVSIERQITNEQGIRRRVGRVAKLLSTVLGLISRSIVGSRGREVDVGLASVDLSILLGSEGGSS